MRSLLAFVLSSAVIFGCGDDGGNGGQGGSGGMAGAAGDGGSGGRGGTGGVEDLVFTISVEPVPPCVLDVPSDYLVEVLVDSAPGPVVIRGDLAGCTGSIDGETNTVRCPNDEDRIFVGFLVESGPGGVLAEGVNISSVMDTCVARSWPHP